MRQLLNGKGLERIPENGITALLSGYKIKGLFESIFSFMLNSFHLTQLTRLGKTSMIASCASCDLRRPKYMLFNLILGQP